jgi:hypothetical protein
MDTAALPTPGTLQHSCVHVFFTLTAASADRTNSDIEPNIKHQLSMLCVLSLQAMIKLAALPG